MSFHLDYYKNVDPDKLYQRDSTTIIFSHSGEWYEAKYPETHKDLLYNEDIYLDVFAGDSEEKMRQQYGDKMMTAMRQVEFRTRPAAVAVAILARYVLHQNAPIDPQEGEGAVLACWNSENHHLFKPFIRSFIAKVQKLGPIEIIKNKIVVTTGYDNWSAVAGEDGKIVWEGSAEAKLLAEYLGDSEEDIRKNINSDTPDVLKKTDEPKIKNQYRIGSRIYSSAELFDMLKRVHTRPWEWENVKAVWCHPDIDLYPELKAIQPSKCSKDSSDLDPRLSDYVRYAQKLGYPLPAGIGGTSESSTKGFEEFFYEMDFCNHPNLFNPHPKWVQINLHRRGA